MDPDGAVARPQIMQTASIHPDAGGKARGPGDRTGICRLSGAPSYV